MHDTTTFREITGVSFLFPDVPLSVDTIRHHRSATLAGRTKS